MLYWRSVDALLMLCWRSVDAHCQVKWHQDERFCLERRPILRLWANSVAHPLDYTRCNTRIRWRSVDAHFQTGAVPMMLFLMHIKAADTSIMGKCHSIALGIYKIQHPRLLMLCGRSVDALLRLCWRCVDALLTLCWRSFSGEVTLTYTVLPIKAAKTSIMGKSRSIALGLYMMQHPTLLTLCWHSFSQLGCDHVAFSFARKGCRYVD